MYMYVAARHRGGQEKRFVIDAEHISVDALLSHDTLVLFFQSLQSLSTEDAGVFCRSVVAPDVRPRDCQYA
jgi:hypothetical protein